MTPATRGWLRELLEAGEFVVTAEIGPPRGTDVEVVRKKAGLVKGFVDAANVTDNQTAMVRMSSLAACRLLVEQGVEPVMQAVCRDRNRLALQSDALGAWALGIGNLLCLSGDHQSFGDQAAAKNVFDVDSIQLLAMLSAMQESGQLPGGAEIKGGFGLLLGAALNPIADPVELRLLRLRKKVAAGARFIQTQCVYDVERFRRFMQAAGDEGLLDRVHVLAGLTPLKSLKMAKYMAEHVSGVEVPNAIIDRMRGAPKNQRAAEGLSLCVELIQQLREIPGVHGVHLMAIEWENRVPDLVRRAGLHPRPEPHAEDRPHSAERAPPARAIS